MDCVEVQGLLFAGGSMFFAWLHADVVGWRFQSLCIGGVSGFVGNSLVLAREGGLENSIRWRLKID